MFGCWKMIGKENLKEKRKKKKKKVMKEINIKFLYIFILEKFNKNITTKNITIYDIQ